MNARVLRMSTAGQTGPLAGKRVVLTRPRAQAGDFEERVRALGGEPIVAPAIAVVPPGTWTITDAALRRVGTYDWIAFTSANALRALLDRASAIGVPLDELRSRQLAVVGPGTGAVVGAALRTPDFVPTVHTADALGWEIPAIENMRVLLPRGDLASDTLPTTLRERGAFVDEIVLYRTVPGPGIADIVSRLQDGAADALLFASASAVHFVADAADTSPASWPVAVCLGPMTADAAREAGVPHVVVAEGTTVDALIERTARWFSGAASDGEG